MFNLPTGGELLIILLVALLVLGPDKLPEAMRKFGRFYGEARRMANGFTSELRSAIDEPKGALHDLKEPLQSFQSTVDEARTGFFSAEPVIPAGAVIDQGRGTPPDVELPGEDVAEGDGVDAADDVADGTVLFGDPPLGHPEVVGDPGLVELEHDPSTPTSPDAER